jgi:hypothetical protein
MTEYLVVTASGFQLLKSLFSEMRFGTSMMAGFARSQPPAD